MENTKKGVSVFTVMSIVVMVAVIATLAVVIYLNVQKSDRIVELETQLASSNEGTTTENSSADVKEIEEDLDEAKEILTNDYIKGAYNAILNYEQTFMQIIITEKRDYSNGTFNSGKFNDDEKCAISCEAAEIFDKNGWENKARKVENDNELTKYYFKKDYITELSEQLFNEDIDYSKVSLSTTDIEVAKPQITGLGVYIYKAKSLVLNEKTGVYTLTFDSLNCNGIEIDTLREYQNETKTSYTSDEIAETFVLTYTQDYTLLTLERTYVKDGYSG